MIKDVCVCVSRRLEHVCLHNVYLHIIRCLYKRGLHSDSSILNTFARSALTASKFVGSTHSLCMNGKLNKNLCLGTQRDPMTQGEKTRKDAQKQGPGMAWRCLETTSIYKLVGELFETFWDAETSTLRLNLLAACVLSSCRCLKIPLQTSLEGIFLGCFCCTNRL